MQPFVGNAAGVMPVLQEEIAMGDVWLILCAAAAMLTAVPALRRLDEAIDKRMDAEPDEAEEPPEPVRPGK